MSFFDQRNKLISDDIVDLKEEDLEERIAIMLQKESKYLPNPHYIEQVQKDGMRVLWRQRVTEWLLEFQEEYGISQDTIAVAVNYMDRYLSKRSTKKEILQLLAMGAVFVAAKLHETYPIGMDELKALADELYYASDIKLMELELLGVIQWNLNPITPQLFLNHLVYYVECPRERQTLREHATVFLDVTLCEYQFIGCLPSIQGAAALICAFESTKISPVAWSESVKKYEFIRSPLVAQCVESMRDLLNKSFAEPVREDSVSPVGVEQFPSIEHDNRETAAMAGHGTMENNQFNMECYENMHDVHTDRLPLFDGKNRCSWGPNQPQYKNQDAKSNLSNSYADFKYVSVKPIAKYPEPMNQAQ